VDDDDDDDDDGLYFPAELIQTILQGELRQNSSKIYVLER